MKTHTAEIVISVTEFNTQYLAIKARMRPLLDVRNPQKLINGITPQELAQLHTITQFDGKTQDLFNQLVSGKITNEWKAFAIFTHFKEISLRVFQEMKEPKKVKLALEALALADAAKYYLARLYLSDKKKYAIMTQHMGDIGLSYWTEFGNEGTSYLYSKLTTASENRTVQDEWVISALSGNNVRLHI